MYQKEKEQQRYLEELYESCMIIWRYLPSSLDLDLGLIKRPGHILDWCDDKMFDVEGFISHVAGNFINKLSIKHKVHIFYVDNSVHFSIDSHDKEGIGKNLICAISDWIKKITEVENIYYNVSIARDKNKNYS